METEQGIAETRGVILVLAPINAQSHDRPPSSCGQIYISALFHGALY